MRFQSAASAAVAAVALAAATGPVVSQAQAQPLQSKAEPRQCFRALDWRGTRAANPRELLLRVGMKDIWRVSFAQDCPGARIPGPVRVENIIAGPANSICATTDFDMWIAPIGSSMSTACIVDKFSKLTPQEVAALPKKDVP